MESVGFPAIADSSCRVLILGSLPGRRSLERRQYYALPRNAFWRILGELLGFDPELEYSQRTTRLLEARIGLWDVCRSAHRPGSLDSSIDARTIVVNDFRRFLDAHAGIELICFNGATAAGLYRRRVLPGLRPGQQSIATVVLPSTSPAHAGMTYARKLAQWAIVRERDPPGINRPGNA